jgi:hypothetical protein
MRTIYPTLAQKPAFFKAPSTAFKTSVLFLSQSSFVSSPGTSIWGEAAEDVLRKAFAAYYIVCTYTESVGGQRWSEKDITHIVQVGKDYNIISEAE